MGRRKDETKSPWVEWPGEGRKSFQEWMAENEVEFNAKMATYQSTKSASKWRWLELLCLDAAWDMLIPSRYDKIDEVEIGNKVIDWSVATPHRVASGITHWTRSTHAPNILVIDHDDISDEEFVSAITWWAGEP
jgi:hypothetical protein